MRRQTAPADCLRIRLFDAQMVRVGRQLRPLAALIIILLLGSLACGNLTLPDFSPATSTPAPVPTPLGDTLQFDIPAYTIRLLPGESVPGANLHYIDRGEEGYRVVIDNLEAIKRAGDSFIWSGVVAPGVYANYNLRLTTAVFGGLPVGGSVEVIVLYPEPQEQALPASLDDSIHYTNAVVNYVVPAGRPVPGTTLRYEGVEAVGVGNESARLARFTGTNGYPYLAAGDSLVWTGELRENVYVRYNLRAISIDENNIRLAGSAELWVTR